RACSTKADSGVTLLWRDVGCANRLWISLAALDTSAPDNFSNFSWILSGQPHPIRRVLMETNGDVAPPILLRFCHTTFASGRPIDGTHHYNENRNWRIHGWVLVATER